MLSSSEKKLIEAMRFSDSDAAKDLLEEGIDVHFSDDYGWTLLHQAVFWGIPEIVRFMLEHGADVEARTDSGETPLHLVSLIEDPAVALMVTRQLLQYASDMDLYEFEFGTTPLFWQGKDVARLLISRGANIDYVAKGGYTPLFWHINSDAEEMVELLIANGADIHRRLVDGTSTLHLAAYIENEQIVQLLVGHGADVNALNEAGWTPLHVAAMEGNEKIVRFLIDKGASKDMLTAKAMFSFPAHVSAYMIAKMMDADERMLKYLQ